jgi:4-hydroxy-3-methylbut-2-en-1-yl diphosphate synthase IspG/GcpE
MVEMQLIEIFVPLKLRADIHFDYRVLQDEVVIVAVAKIAINLTGVSEYAVSEVGNHGIRHRAVPEEKAALVEHKENRR